MLLLLLLLLLHRVPGLVLHHPCRGPWLPLVVLDLLLLLLARVHRLGSLMVRKARLML